MNINICPFSTRSNANCIYFVLSHLYSCMCICLLKLFRIGKKRFSLSHSFYFTLNFISVVIAFTIQAHIHNDFSSLFNVHTKNFFISFADIIRQNKNFKSFVYFEFSSHTFRGDRWFHSLRGSQCLKFCIRLFNINRRLSMCIVQAYECDHEREKKNTVL